MSVLTQKAPAAKSRAASGVVVGLPQVNLLPPEIRATRAFATVKRWLVIALVIVVAAVGAVYALAALDRGAAVNELADADAETVRLRIEERKYAEVPLVLGAISSTTDARTTGMADEVLWKGYLDAITAVLPADVSLDSFQLTGPSPLEGTPMADDPLQGASVGTITFMARTRTIPVTADWLDALETVPGFSNPWASAIAAGENESGSTYYTVALSVDLTDAAFANRFAATAQEGN